MAEPVLRRQSIAEQVEGILQDAESRKVGIAGSARGILQQVTNGQKGQNDLFPSGAFDSGVAVAADGEHDLLRRYRGHCWPGARSSARDVWAG